MSCREASSSNSNIFSSRINGTADRLRGTELYVDRDALPVPEAEEYYHADLIGLAAETREGGCFGTVKAVHNFGAGDLLEVTRDDGGIDMLPFTRAVVPVIDFDGHRLVVEPPYELMARPDESDEPAQEAGQP